MQRSNQSIFIVILVNALIFLFTSCALTHPFKPTEKTPASTNTATTSSSNSSFFTGTWKQARLHDTPWLGDELQFNADTSWKYLTNGGDHIRGISGIFSSEGTFVFNQPEVYSLASGSWYLVGGEWTGYYFLDSQDLYFNTFRQETTDTNVMGVWKTMYSEVAYKVNTTNVQIYSTNFFTKSITSSNVDFSNASGGSFRLYYKLSSTGEFGYFGSLTPAKVRFIKQ